MKTALIALAVCLLAGCQAFQPTPKPQSGGALSVDVPGGLAITNPAPVIIRTIGPENADTPTTTTWRRSYTSPNGHTTHEEWAAELGVNQHDKARDDWAVVRKFEAHLKSYGQIRVFGFILILGALAMFHPAVRAFTGTTGQLATGAVGLVLIFGGNVLAGHETLVMVASIIALAVYWFARRHGVLQGRVDAISPPK
jgi:hypothetical protein